MKRAVTVRLPVDLHDRARILARVLGEPFGDLVEKGLIAEIALREREGGDELERAIESVEAFRAAAQL